jgi:hypothetical protein
MAETLTPGHGLRKYDEGDHPGAAQLNANWAQIDVRLVGVANAFPAIYPVSGLFLRTDENKLYENTGTEAVPAWTLRLSAAAAGPPAAHAPSHQAAGSDVVDVTGLSGLLADPQTPAAHSHPPGDISPQGHTSGLDADTLDGLHAADIIGGAPAAHGPSHEQGGSDPTPSVPATNEKSALLGTDGVPGPANRYVTNSDPRNANARPPTPHPHSPGDIFPQGHTSGLDADTLDGFHAGAFAPAGPPAPHATSHHSAGGDPLSLPSIAGVITDAQHGTRAGGTLHPIATADPGGVPGFLSGADKKKLNDLAASVGASGSNVIVMWFPLLPQPSSAGTPASASTASASYEVKARFLFNFDRLNIPGMTKSGKLYVRGMVNAGNGNVKLVNVTDAADLGIINFTETVFTTKEVLLGAIPASGTKIIEIQMQRVTGGTTITVEASSADLVLTVP